MVGDGVGGVADAGAAHSELPRDGAGGIAGSAHNFS